MMNMTTDPMMPDQRGQIPAGQRDVVRAQRLSHQGGDGGAKRKARHEAQRLRPGLPASLPPSEMVPSEAMIDEVMTKAPEVVKRSNITGKLTRKTS